MTATTADLTAAQAGARIAVISRTLEDARAELDRLAPFAGTEASIRRAKDRAAITYSGGGAIHFHSAAGDGLRGHTCDRVHLAVDAVTDDAIADARHALTPDGEFYIGAHLVDPYRDDAGS